MKSAGHTHAETQGVNAGEPGGQAEIETAFAQAARRKSKPAGHTALETQSTHARNGADRGHYMTETHRTVASVRATIDLLIEVGRRDDFAIRQRMRIRQATLSHIARSEFGYHTHLPEAERKTAMDAATILIKAIEIVAGIKKMPKKPSQVLLTQIEACKAQTHGAEFLVRATDLATAPWEEIQTSAEKEMIKLTRHLPAYEWVQGVRGFGELSFARIIAETGDLSGYANPSTVWKRLGLAVFDGHAQRRTRDAEKAVEQGYSPQRRSTSWVAFHSVYLAQSARTKSGGHELGETQQPDAAGDDGVGQHQDETQSAVANSESNGADDHNSSETQSKCVVGPYRQLYDTKKLEYLERVDAGEAGWTKLRADRAAKRYAEKRLLRDLWVAWTQEAGHARGETHTSIAGDGDRDGQARPETHDCDAAPVATE